MGSALFFAVAPSSVAGLVPWWITRWEFRPPFFDLDATRAVGILLIVAGLPGLVDSFARFALQGLGTPAPIAPTQNLVVTGLYRYVRNLRCPCRRHSGPSGLVRRPAPSCVRCVGVARLPRVCRGVRGAGARSQVRNGVRGFPGQRPALDSAAHALASRTTPESFVTRAPPREGRGSVPCRNGAPDAIRTCDLC